MHVNNNSVTLTFSITKTEVFFCTDIQRAFISLTIAYFLVYFDEHQKKLSKFKTQFQNTGKTDYIFLTLFASKQWLFSLFWTCNLVTVCHFIQFPNRILLRICNVCCFGQECRKRHKTFRHKHMSRW